MAWINTSGVKDRKRIIAHENCINFLSSAEREKFRNFLNGNKISGLNMFIAKTPLYAEYCENLFSWLVLIVSIALLVSACAKSDDSSSSASTASSNETTASAVIR